MLIFHSSSHIKLKQCTWISLNLYAFDLELSCTRARALYFSTSRESSQPLCRIVTRPRTVWSIRPCGGKGVVYECIDLARVVIMYNLDR